MEGKLPRQHLIEHDAYGIEIRFIIRNFAARLLRADIMNGANRALRHCAGFAAAEAGNTKICYLDVAILQEHDILRLDITVHNSFIMCMLKRAQDLCDKMNRFFPVNDLLLLNILLKRDTLDILHHNILEPVSKTYIIHFYDIRVREHSNCLRLIFEAAAELLIL